MIVVRAAGLATMLLAAWISSCYAGPCSSQIEDMAARIDNARAAGGLGAPESTAALQHRQPTRQSIEAAEQALGEQANEASRALARARAADLADDQQGCAEALSEVRRAIEQ